MENIDIKYNAIGVIKSQICSTIAQSENVRKALNYQGENYDEDDPLSLIYNCIMPYLQYPETLTTTEPLLFVGVQTVENTRNPYLLNATVNIICVVDKDDMRTSQGYFRNDLVENGCVCYTKTDWIADEIIKCLSSFSGTWIGDIDNIESKEYAMNNTRYARSLNFRLKEVNIGKLIQND